MMTLANRWACALIFLLTVFSLSSQAGSVGGLPDFTQLVKKNSPAVVKITTKAKSGGYQSGQLPDDHQQIPEIFRHFLDPRLLQERQRESMGSGFIISVDGYVLTNQHVVNGADDIMVRLSDQREYSATLVGEDSRSDIALLKIEADDLPTVKIKPNIDLEVGEWVLAIGSPFGLDYSVSAGIVSAMGRSIPTERNENYVPFIQTDVAINPGNSGGPLFNLNGQVVGINSQIFTRSGGSNGISFAIPIGLAMEVVEQLKDHGHVVRGWLGVVIQEVDKRLADSFELDKPKGALVVQMVDDGPADEAGLREGDVIIAFDQQPVGTSAELPHIVGRTRVGKTVTVKVMREGKLKQLSLTVGKLPGLPNDATETASASKTVGGRLGLLVDDLSVAEKKKLGSDGVVVRQVVPGGVAAKAGIRKGDVIAQLGFNVVESSDDYGDIVADLPANQLIAVRIVRRGVPSFQTLTIDE